jgi:hypothetical protein
MPISLTGNNEINKINLTGSVNSNMNNSIKIHNLKKYILANYIIPLYSDQWIILNNNKLLIDRTIKQINDYYKLYKLDELIIFLELLKIIKILINKNDLLVDLEDKTTSIKFDKNNITSMIYKTTRIQLLPEYEIYNSIVGKPERGGDNYNEDIISDIKKLIIKDTITYDKISDFIKKKYNLT